MELKDDNTTVATATMSIYRASRTIKRSDNSLYNALRSIYSDSVFVGEIAQLWPELPLLANLRCGLWYGPKFDATCYFKSTDGHTNNWSFNTSRLNLHVAVLAGQKGGCIVVDSTRKGKRFPDSMSKTIPIWTCVLNRAIAKYKYRMCGSSISGEEDSNTSTQLSKHNEKPLSDWDCSLHLPLWVPPTEKSSIEDRLENWVINLEASGADISSLVLSLKKPLRPLWISPKTVIWLNEVPDHNFWDFTPIILVSTSPENGICQHRTSSEFSWNYISGAGDDEESWARGLSPTLFWKYANEIIDLGPDLCNQKVADIVEKDRVYRAHRGYNSPQFSIKTSKSLVDDTKMDFEISGCDRKEGFSSDDRSVFWVGSTNIAVGAIRFAAHVSDEDCILNCESVPFSISIINPETHLHLPIVSSKFDRISIMKHLPAALNFAKINLRRGKKIIICCNDGEDISICVCLAILTSLYTEEELFDDGESFSKTRVTKLDMRKRLVYICKYAVNARPSRGNLRQVFNFLIGGNISCDRNLS